MKVVAVIQARMGSTRLPGKVMLPLAGEHVINHVISRVATASNVDETVVATSTGKQDDIIERYASRGGATVFRGSESDVLARMFSAAHEADADIVVRITADCPLVAPEVIDATVKRLQQKGIEYVSTDIELTFPRGIGAESFTFESFEIVEEMTGEPYEREHVTTAYLEQPERFSTENIASDDVYNADRYRDRTDLRLTLDEADDYELIRRLYNELEWSETLSVRNAIDYIDNNDLAEINNHVHQKSLDEIKNETT